MCNGLLAVVIKMEEGEALDTEKAVCLGGARSLTSGLPFYACSVLIAMAWSVIKKFKHLEPGAGGERADGNGDEGSGGGEGKDDGEIMKLNIVSPTHNLSSDKN